jgi:hypothetical protein
MTKPALFPPVFLVIMTSRAVIFFRTKGERVSLEIAIIYHNKIFVLSKQFSRKKTAITEHKKSPFPHTWYHGNRLIYVFTNNPTGAHGGGHRRKREILCP